MCEQSARRPCGKGVGVNCTGWAASSRCFDARSLRWVRGVQSALFTATRNAAVKLTLSEKISLTACKSVIMPSLSRMHEKKRTVNANEVARATKLSEPFE